MGDAALNGVKILSEKVVKVWTPLTIVLIALVIVIALVIIIKAVTNSDYSEYSGTVVFGTLTVGVCLVLLIHSYATYSSELNTEYVVTIDESVDIEEFDRKYIVISKLDDLYVVRQR